MEENALHSDLDITSSSSVRRLFDEEIEQYNLKENQKYNIIRRIASTIDK